MSGRDKNDRAVLVDVSRSVEVTSIGGINAVGAGKGGFLFSACSGANRMCLHDANEAAEVVSLEAQGQRPASVAISRDAVKVAFGTGAGAIYLWDVLYPTAMESFRTEDSVAAGAITKMAWHPRGHVLAAASEAGVVHLWDMVVGALLFPFPCHEGPIADIAWTGNGRMLLTAGQDGALRAWSPRDVEFMGSVSRDDEDLASNSLIPGGRSDSHGRNSQPRRSRQVHINGDSENELRAPPSVRWHSSAITCLDVMLDMSRVAITGGDDGSVLLSVLKPEQGCGVFHAMPSHSAPVTTVKFSDLECPKPLRSASGAEDGTIFLFDMDRRLPMSKFLHSGGRVEKLLFTPSADVLFSAAGTTVHAWDARVSPEEAPSVCFGGHDKAVLDFTVVNAGATVAAACEDGKLRLYDMRYPAGVAPSMP